MTPKTATTEIMMNTNSHTTEKTNELPHRIEAETARHDRIAFEMAFEKPKRRLDVELGDDFTLAVQAAFFGNTRDPVEHQHWRQRQLRVARAEQTTVSALDEIFVRVATFLIKRQPSLVQSLSLLFRRYQYRRSNYNTTARRMCVCKFPVTLPYPRSCRVSDQTSR